ncbi:RNA polymerase sigma factor [Streptomyces chartreusis]|uniref:RNA polymerase sigma factor n=1 Tax=Streptomyces chartreusis TaxID=1969 RepID=UPI0036A31442
MVDRDRLRSRHAEALAELVEERYDQMVRYAASRLRTRDVPQTSADPEDIVQNALKAVLARDEPIGNVRAYLYTCMAHEIDRAARNHYAGRGYESLDADVRLEDEPTVRPVEEAELRHVIDEALAGLPLQQRRAMLLTRELGMTHMEAAQVLRSAPGTVGVHVHRAIRALRVTLVGVSTALVAWISCGRAVGLREVIPAAGVDSPAGAVTLGLASTVGVLLTVLVGLAMWTTGNSSPRWTEVIKSLLKPVEPARVGRDRRPYSSSAGSSEFYNQPEGGFFFSGGNGNSPG